MNTKLKRGKEYYVMFPIVVASDELSIKEFIENLEKWAGITTAGYGISASQSCVQFIEVEE